MLFKFSVSVSYEQEKLSTVHILSHITSLQILSSLWWTSAEPRRIDWDRHWLYVDNIKSPGEVKSNNLNNANVLEHVSCWIQLP